MQRSTRRSCDGVCWSAADDSARSTDCFADWEWLRNGDDADKAKRTRRCGGAADRQQGKGRLSFEGREEAGIATERWFVLDLRRMTFSVRDRVLQQLHSPPASAPHRTSSLVEGYRLPPTAYRLPPGHPLQLSPCLAPAPTPRASLLTCDLRPATPSLSSLPRARCIPTRRISVLVGPHVTALSS